MAIPSFHALVRFPEQDPRVIAVFEPLFAGEHLPGLEGWVIRDVQVRTEEVDGVPTQCEIWVEPTRE
jgi:hypothetical protein